MPVSKQPLYSTSSFLRPGALTRLPSAPGRVNCRQVPGPTAERSVRADHCQDPSSPNSFPFSHSTWGLKLVHTSDTPHTPYSHMYVHTHEFHIPYTHAYSHTCYLTLLCTGAWSEAPHSTSRLHFVSLRDALLTPLSAPSVLCHVPLTFGLKPSLSPSVSP